MEGMSGSVGGGMGEDDEWECEGVVGPIDKNADPWNYIPLTTDNYQPRRSQPHLCLFTFHLYYMQSRINVSYLYCFIIIKHCISIIEYCVV